MKIARLRNMLTYPGLRMRSMIRDLVVGQPVPPPSILRIPKRC